MPWTDLCLRHHASGPFRGYKIEWGLPRSKSKFEWDAPCFGLFDTAKYFCVGVGIRDLDQPTPRGLAEPWKITQPALKGRTLSTSCSTVSGLAASCSPHLQPGADRVTVSTRQDKPTGS